MIFGIGTDIVETKRIAEAVNRHGTHFSDYIPTEWEQAESERHSDKIQFIASRWAAKEAVAKALGCGFGAHCAWRDIEIRHSSSGAPVVSLSGHGLETMRSLGIARILISISHEHSCSVAFAVAEKESNQQ